MLDEALDYIANEMETWPLMSVNELITTFTTGPIRLKLYLALLKQHPMLRVSKTILILDMISIAFKMNFYDRDTPTRSKGFYADCLIGGTVRQTLLHLMAEEALK